MLNLESLIWIGQNLYFMGNASDLKEIASLIETGAYAREVRRIVRVVRLTMALRRKLNAQVLSAFLGFAVAPGSELHSRLSSYLPKVTLEALWFWVFLKFLFSITIACCAWNDFYFLE